MQISYELTVEDFTQACTAHRKTKTWWIVLRILLVVGALGGWPTLRAFRRVGSRNPGTDGTYTFFRD